MNLPYYIKYCVKCGEYNHLHTECNNMDNMKLSYIENDHQYRMINFVYNTFPRFCNIQNENNEFECKECKRVFREYKYYIYH